MQSASKLAIGSFFKILLCMYVLFVDFFRIDQSFQKSLIDFTVKDFTVKKRQNSTYVCYVLTY